jgi:hypothetical protein
MHQCCPSGGSDLKNSEGVTRRDFIKTMGGSTLSVVALSGLTWPLLSGLVREESQGIIRRPLVVKPILVYDTPEYQFQTSWRSWGGIHTGQAATDEIARIADELNKLRSVADFPVSFLPVAGIRNTAELNALGDLASADTFLIYAAGGWMDIFESLNKMNKDMILFCRHKSGPVYLWYEIISPRFLRQHTDKLSVPGVDEDDVIIDNQDEILWRLRSLCGLHNTLNTKIIAIGGAGAWAQPEGVVPRLIEEKFKLRIYSYSYDELGSLIREIHADGAAVKRAEKRAEEYLRGSGVTLETKRQFVDNAFLLEDIFKRIMDKENCRSLTINGCMGTIMPMAETSACLTLSLLNDSGYPSFCESDFVVVPAGILLTNISGKPSFLNDPTYPHDGIITLAHCTAPRCMDGKNPEPARLLTHFESDYGAAPKVEMKLGQTVTNIIPDFLVSNYVGLKGRITDNPFMDICRSQIDISFDCDSKVLAKRMPGFHWITGYGDYVRETGYALKRLGIKWEVLG